MGSDYRNFGYCKKTRFVGKRRATRKLYSEQLESRLQLAGDLDALSMLHIDSNSHIVGRYQSAGDKVFFIGQTLQHGIEVQVIDTTTLDQFTLDVNPGVAGSNPQDLTVVGDRVFFNARDEALGDELRWFDASDAIPELHSLDVNPGPDDSNAGQNGGFTIVGDRLFFVAATNDREQLHWIDTTEVDPAIHTMNIDLQPTSTYPRSYFPLPDIGFGAADDKLYFSVSSAEVALLKWFDITEQSPTVHKIDLVQDARSLSNFTRIGNKLFFVAHANNGSELRWIDTADESPRVNTIINHDLLSYSYFGEAEVLRAIGDKLVFNARDVVHGYATRWIDVTENVPIVHTLNDQPCCLSPMEIGVAGEKVFYSSDEIGSAIEWIDLSEGASATVNTIRLDIGDDFAAYAGYHSGYTFAGNKLFFNARDSAHGYELRWLDLSVESPSVHTIDVAPGELSSDAGQYGGILAANGKVFFSAFDKVNGRALRWVDPIEPSQAHTIGGPNTSPEGLGWQDSRSFAVVGPKVFLSGYSRLYGHELYWMDTNATPPVANVIDIAGGSEVYFGSASPDSSNPGTYSGFQTVGNKLFFSATDPTHGHELRWVDVSMEPPTIHTLEIEPGNLGSFAGAYGGFAVAGDKLYFSAFDSAHGWELRWIDTTLGLPVVNTFDIEIGSRDSFPGQYGGFLPVDDRLYFTAYDREHGWELRWIEIAEETISSISTLDISPGMTSSYAGSRGGFTRHDSRLFFSAHDEVHGEELRWVDTKEIDPQWRTLDIEPGSDSSRPGRQLAPEIVADKLFFSAHDDAKGFELWWVDMSMTDSQEPQQLGSVLNNRNHYFYSDTSNVASTSVGDKLFFMTAENTAGGQLRWIDASATRPTLNSLPLTKALGWSNSPARNLVAVGSILFVSLYDAKHGDELRWIETDANTLHMNTIDINRGPRDSTPSGFTPMGNNLIFHARDADYNNIYLLHAPELVLMLPGDVNSDKSVDRKDVDLICRSIGDDFSESLDVDQNGSIEYLDLVMVVESQIGSSLGDANLDGTIDATDLNHIGKNWQRRGDLGWNNGDLTCDGIVDNGDLSLIAHNWTTNVRPKHIPGLFGLAHLFPEQVDDALWRVGVEPISKLSAFSKNDSQKSERQVWRHIENRRRPMTHFRQSIASRRNLHNTQTTDKLNGTSHRILGFAIEISQTANESQRE